MLLNRREESEQRFVIKNIIFFNPVLMLAARLDYVWVRVNNMKMAHEVTTKSKDLNTMRKWRSIRKKEILRLCKCYHFLNMRWAIIIVGVIQRKFTRKVGQKKQQKQIKDTAKATIIIKKNTRNTKETQNLKTY